MHLGKAIATLALAGALEFSSFTVANAQQPPSPPGQPTNQAAGGFGPTWLGAVIDSAGNHVAGTGGLGLVSSAKLSTGNYEVIFRRQLDRCVPIASIGNRAFGSALGHVDVVARSGNPKGYFVQTRDTSGAAADLNFTLLIYCTA